MSENDYSSALEKLQDANQALKSKLKREKERKSEFDSFFRFSQTAMFIMRNDEPFDIKSSGDRDELIHHSFEHTRVVDVNISYLNKYGIDKEEFTGISANDIFSGFGAEGIGFWKQLLTRGSIKIQFQDPRATGSPVWIEAEFVCTYNDEGKIKGCFANYYDYTALKQTEEELTYTNRNLIHTFESIPYGVIICGGDDKVLFLNNSAEKLTNFEFAEAQGKDFYQVFNLENIATYQEIRNGLDSGLGLLMPYQFATGTTILNRNGDRVEIKGSFSAVLRDDNSYAGSVIIFYDSSSADLGEKELKESEERLNRAQSVSNVGSWELDLMTGSFWVSEEAFRIYGIPRTNFNFSFEEAQEFQERIQKLINPNDKENISSALMNLLQTEQKYDIELRLNRENDGELRIIHSKAELVKNEFGMPSKILGIIQDITDRKKNDELILKLSRAVNQSPASIVITNTLGEIEYVNRSYCDVTGYSSVEAFGKKPAIFSLMNVAGESGQEIHEKVKSGAEWAGEYFNFRRNGESYWEYLRISPIFNDHHELIHYLLIGEDVSLRKEYEKNLKEARDHAEELSKLKSTILANMSHELRTPMNGILGLSQILKHEITEELHRAMIDNILKSGYRLMTTVNSIIDFSYLESDEMQPEAIECDVTITIEDLIPRFEEITTEKHLKLVVDLTQELICIIDESLLQKAIIHIFDNAIKFTDSGKITLSTKRAINSLGRKEALIIISDTGIGINKKHQDVIFSEFRQVSEGLSRAYEGAGLGLTISKKLINAMGGKIDVDSTVGFGTTITIRFEEISFSGSVEKNYEIAQTHQKQQFSASAELPKVLLVEDNAINRDVIELFLRNICKITYAPEGESAIALAKTIRFDTVLLDINLGKGLDGIEVAKELRKLPGYETLPMIAVTGYALAGDKKRILENGLTHYVPKPFQMGEFVELIVGVLSKR